MAADTIHVSIHRWQIFIITVLGIALHMPVVCGKTLTSPPLSVINSSSHLSGFVDIKSKYICVLFALKPNVLFSLVCHSTRDNEMCGDGH